MWKSITSKFDSTDSLVSLALGLAVVLIIGMTVVNYFKSRTQVATSTTKQEQAAAMTATPSLPTKYVVKDGDTLWSIAQTYYKSGYNWVDIVNANSIVNPNSIEAGQTFSIPAAKPIMPEAETSSASTSIAPKNATYTVVTGDDLWNIAVSQYGDGYRWVDIAKANALSEPDMIFAGNVLKMP